MNRKILILSTFMVVVGLVVLVYADPLARLSFGGGGGPGTFFGSNTTRTFTFSNRTVTFTPGSGTGGFGGTGGFVGRTVNTNGQIETLVAIALVAVGLVLEVLFIVLWQGKTTSAPQPSSGTTQP